MRHAFLGVIALVVACGGSQIAEHHPADTSKLLPATLEAARPQTGDPRTVKVRIYADAGVRAQTHWKEDITEQVDYASQLLTPLLGVRLQVDGEIKEWNRTGDPHAALADLVALDKGENVGWVIGYIVANDTASKAMPELGDAAPLGHHVVVHAWATAPETEAIAATLPDLKQNERTEILAAHQRHKQTVVLLHMLAATLGAIGEEDASWIQHPLYSPKMSTFSERNRELLQLAIDKRIAHAPDTEVAHDLLESIEKTEWGGWIAADHDQVVTLLRATVDAARAGKTATDVPPSAYAQFDRIRELAKRGATKDALAELDNLLAAYPGNATMHQLKCDILLGTKDAAASSACARAIELAPGDPNPHFAIAESELKTHDFAGARKELLAAAGKIANLKTGGPEAWKKLVEMYMSMGALTWAEEAANAGKLDQDPAIVQIAQIRARYALPKGWKVKPEQEGPLVDATRAAIAAAGTGQYTVAEQAIAAAEKKWPGAPGIATARCELQFRRNQLDDARAACNRAIAAAPNASWALYLSGVLALRDTSAAGTKTGIAQLKKAIAADPELGQAWRALGKAYTRAKDKAAFAELEKEYAAKFGQPLPP